MCTLCTHTCAHHLPTRYCPPCALCTLYAAHHTDQHVHCTLPSAHHQKSVHCAQKNIAQNSISKESHEQCKRRVQVCSAFQLPAKAVIKQHHHYSLFIAIQLSPPLWWGWSNCLIKQQGPMPMCLTLCIFTPPMNDSGTGFCNNDQKEKSQE